MSYLSTRRAFLQKGLTLMAAGATVPTFLDATAFALNDPRDQALVQRPSGKDDRILVVVQLSGGNDGLNTIIPYADDTYYRARPGLGIPARELIRLNDHVGLHPNLAPWQGMLDAGSLAVIQGVGYPNPNRSHFRSMDILHSADLQNENPTQGWLGRYFDATCDGEDPHTGVSLGDTLPLAMQGEQITPLSFDDPESYRYVGPAHETYSKLNHADDLMATSARPPVRSGPLAGVGEAEQLSFLTRTALNAQRSSDQILRTTRAFEPTGDYPRSAFGQGLRTIAALIGGGLSTRVYYVSLGGFDTHANQRGPHDRLMQELAGGVQAFQTDLKAQGNEQRVLTLCFSEFGRRVQQNASNGTDHGAAAPMFLFGDSVRGGVHGGHPSLTDLVQGDLKFSIDFRQVYATVLQQWLQTPPRQVLGAQFRPLPIL